GLAEGGGDRGCEQLTVRHGALAVGGADDLGAVMDGDGDRRGGGVEGEQQHGSSLVRPWARSPGAQPRSSVERSGTPSQRGPCGRTVTTRMSSDSTPDVVPSGS